MIRRALCFVLFLCLATSLAALARGQGSAADYRRSRDLPRKVRNTIFRRDVRPQWLPGEQRFWYRISVAPGEHQFVLVDAAKKKRQEAFDHGRLAKSLSKTLKKDVSPSRLGLERLEFDSQNRLTGFRLAGGLWAIDPETYEVSRSERKNETTGRESQRLRPSRRSDDDTHVRFVNKTKQTVELIWINLSGRRQSYGKLEAGKERRQHTFAGHVWLIVDQDGVSRAVYEAVQDESTLVIDDKLLNGKVQTDRPRRSPRRATRESPDGRYRASIEQYNVVVFDTEKDESFQLTNDGTESDHYEGRFYWSPDSSKLVVLQSEVGDTREVHLIESSPADQLQPKLHKYRYAKPGDKLTRRRPRLLDVTNRKTVQVDNELFSNPWSIDELRWAEDGSRFTFLYNQRGHQILRLVEVDAETGESRAVIDEVSKTFVDYAHKRFLRYLPETDELIWMSERDGWNHLYLIDRASGKVKHQMTKGQWVVRGVEEVDVEKRRIWFKAGGVHSNQSPYHVHLCRVDFDGNNLCVLTAGDGTHSWRFSPNREWLIDTWSRVDQPPVVEVRSAKSGDLVCELERADDTRLRDTGWRPPERFVAPGRDGKTPIHGIIIRPTNFDPAKRYPVIEKIYAGPHSAHVPVAWGTQSQARSIAELGFVVVQIDGMGTSHRSKAFHDVCWKNLGDAGFPDRIAWLRAAAKKFPEMDLSRVGIYGGSAGGQNALRAMLAHPDFYHAAVADCGCHDNRMDKVWWNELWMSWPIGPHYKEQSNVTQAHRLKGKLLLIVGELDRNVDPASTMQVVNALIKADKDFDLLVMTGVGHGAAERPYSSRRRMDFFVRHLWKREPRH